LHPKQPGFVKDLLARFAADETAATAIEYGLIAGLISIVIIGAVTKLGKDIPQCDRGKPQLIGRETALGRPQSPAASPGVDAAGTPAPGNLKLDIRERSLVRVRCPINGGTAAVCS
jgi:pilus assembly protein Flp/PilA